MPSARKSNRTDQQKKELKRGGLLGFGTENIASIVSKITDLEEKVFTVNLYDNLITQSDIDGIKNSLAIDKDTITTIKTNYKDALVPFLKFKILMEYLKKNDKSIKDDTDKKILIIQKLVNLLQEVVTKVQTALGQSKEEEEAGGEEGEGEPNLDELKNTALKVISDARGRIQQSSQLQPATKETMLILVDQLDEQLDNDNIQPKDIQKIIEDANKIAIPETVFVGGKKSKRSGGGSCVMSPEMKKIINTGHLF